MNKKHGFTLIELLAVIVILAIIALIATPIITKVIEDSKKAAAERSAENYVRTVELTVATERFDKKEIKGEYEIQEDGSLCPEAGCGKNDANKIKIDMNGNKPSSGSIFIDKGSVTTSSIMGIGDYTVSYDEEGKLEASYEVPTVAEVGCTYQGADESQKYAYGAEYSCNPGDGESRTFYVLEDGDNTPLTDDTGRIAQAGEVSLIMSENIDSTEVLYANALSHLNALTSEWTVGSVSLPTAFQVARAGENNDWNLEQFPVYFSAAWLSSGSAYWTSTQISSTGGHYIIGSGNIIPVEDNNEDIYVRPVITMSKD